MAAPQLSPTSAAVVHRTTACRMWFAIMRLLWCGSVTQTLDRHSRPRSWQSVMTSKFRERRCAAGCDRRGSGCPALNASASSNLGIAASILVSWSRSTAQSIAGSEDRAAVCTLFVFVDDAASRLMELRVCASESTFSYFYALQA